MSELVIERTFDAPRDLVWKAWTVPEHVMRWWGPKSYTSPYCRIDLRVGGVLHMSMRSPEGEDYWNTGTYKEIVEPEKLVATDSFSDAEGHVVPATYYGMSEDYPLEMLMTVTFEEQEGKTKMTLRHVGLPAGENTDLTKAGWTESFDKLDELLVRMRKGDIAA